MDGGEQAGGRQRRVEREQRDAAVDGDVAQVGRERRVGREQRAAQQRKDPARHRPERRDEALGLRGVGLARVRRDDVLGEQHDQPVLQQQPPLAEPLVDGGAHHLVGEQAHHRLGLHALEDLARRACHAQLHRVQPHPPHHHPPRPSRRGGGGALLSGGGRGVGLGGGDDGSQPRGRWRGRPLPLREVTRRVAIVGPPARRVGPAHPPRRQRPTRCHRRRGRGGGGGGGGGVGLRVGGDGRGGKGCLLAGEGLRNVGMRRVGAGAVAVVAVVAVGRGGAHDGGVHDGELQRRHHLELEVEAGARRKLEVEADGGVRVAAREVVELRHLRVGLEHAVRAAHVQVRVRAQPHEQLRAVRRRELLVHVVGERARLDSAGDAARVEVEQPTRAQRQRAERRELRPAAVGAAALWRDAEQRDGDAERRGVLAQLLVQPRLLARPRHRHLRLLHRLGVGAAHAAAHTATATTAATTLSAATAANLAALERLERRLHVHQPQRVTRRRRRRRRAPRRRLPPRTARRSSSSSSARFGGGQLAVAIVGWASEHQQQPHAVEARDRAEQLVVRPVAQRVEHLAQRRAEAAPPLLARLDRAAAQRLDGRADPRGAAADGGELLRPRGHLEQRHLGLALRRQRQQLHVRHRRREQVRADEVGELDDPE